MQLQVKVKEGFGVGQRKAKLSRSMQMFDKKHAKEDKIMQYTSYVREKILEKYPESTVKVQKKYILTPLTPLKLFQITLNLFLEFKLFTQKNQEAILYADTYNINKVLAIFRASAAYCEDLNQSNQPLPQR